MPGITCGKYNKNIRRFFYTISVVYNAAVLCTMLCYYFMNNNMSSSYCATPTYLYSSLYIQDAICVFFSTRSCTYFALFHDKI